MPRAIFIGRFQPFHKGHLSAVRHIEKKVGSCIICLTVCARDQKNPFSVANRKKMIRTAGVTQRLALIHDQSSDAAWSWMILKRFKPDVIFSNNPWTRRCFRGKNVEVERIPVTYKISGTRVRALIKKGETGKDTFPREQQR